MNKSRDTIIWCSIIRDTRGLLHFMVVSQYLAYNSVRGRDVTKRQALESLPLKIRRVPDRWRQASHKCWGQAQWQEGGKGGDLMDNDFYFHKACLNVRREGRNILQLITTACICKTLMRGGYQRQEAVKHKENELKRKVKHNNQLQFHIRKSPWLRRLFI